MNLFKILKHEAFSHIASLIPVTIWHEITRTKIIIPRWHVTSDSALPHIEGIYKFRKPMLFKKDLDFLLKYYEPISLGELIKSLDFNNEFKSRRFLATFDDGFREIYDVIAPILYKLGVPAIFFLTTSAIDNQMLTYDQKKSLIIWKIINLKDPQVLSEVHKIFIRRGILNNDIISIIKTISYYEQSILDDIATLIGVDFNSYLLSNKPYLTCEQVSRLMEQGFNIGAHSIDHPSFLEISLEEQIYQTIYSASWLSLKFNYICDSFAFPVSDQHVLPEYFQRVFAESPIKVTFGTGGLIKRGHAKNFPRCSAERTNAPIKQIISKDCARYLLKK